MAGERISGSIDGQLDACFEAMHRIDGIYDAYARHVGVSPTRLMILDYLFDHDGASQHAICDYLKLPRQTVNNVVAACAQEGLVRLDADPGDRRVRTVRFTDDGARYRDALILPLRRAEARAMGTLGEEDRERMLNAMGRFVDALDAQIGMLPA
ncbi:MAG: MarR family winged helix-turn-helix transcriptional regulator [Bifidobacterium sp.]|nr:MarR family winged helix-turn-helix transcriptional regulator [Bifidobacterium sp.]